MNTSTHTVGRIGPRTTPGPGPLQRHYPSLAAAFEAIRAFVRHAYVRYRQQRRAREAFDALRELDDHVLRDLGFHRSEIGSVVAELAGSAPPSRIRALQSLHDRVQ